MPESLNFSRESENRHRKPDAVRFSDGRVGRGASEKGEVFKFGEKYTNPNHTPTTILVRTESGRFYALGQGVMVELPDLDHETGKFGSEGEEVRAIALKDIPTRVVDINIGEPWKTLGGDERIIQVMYDYKTDHSLSGEYYQSHLPNPFDSAREHLSRVRMAMEAQGKF